MVASLWCVRCPTHCPQLKASTHYAIKSNVRMRELTVISVPFFSSSGLHSLLTWTSLNSSEPIQIMRSWRRTAVDWSCTWTTLRVICRQIEPWCNLPLSSVGNYTSHLWRIVSRATSIPPLPPRIHFRSPPHTHYGVRRRRRLPPYMRQSHSPSSTTRHYTWHILVPRGPLVPFVPLVKKTLRCSWRVKWLRIIYSYPMTIMCAVAIISKSTRLFVPHRTMRHYDVVCLMARWTALPPIMPHTRNFKKTTMSTHPVGCRVWRLLSHYYLPLLTDNGLTHTPLVQPSCNKSHFALVIW